MSGTPALLISVALLAVVMYLAIRGTSDLIEAAVAAAAAGLVVLLGIVTPQRAGTELHDIAQTIAFLAAILVFAHLQQQAGVFRYLAARAARVSRGSPSALLALVVVLAVATTTVLTLDSTVVLLTPVVVATARRLRVPAMPYATACVHIANSGSLLLPVANLTNLLAFAASGLSFSRFAALMALPWLICCAIEWVVLRRGVRVRADRPRRGGRTGRRRAAGRPGGTGDHVGRVRDPAGPRPAPGLGRRGRRTCRCSRSARPHHHLSLVMSSGWPIRVPALRRIPRGHRRWCRRPRRHALLAHVIPAGTSLPRLLAITGIAAIMANLVNNIPARMVLLPMVAGSPLAVLAVLIGVNVGPNLTWSGSLATLLWRRRLPAADRPSTGGSPCWGWPR